MSQRLKLGLIGQPVAHSKSPLIHQHFADQLGYELSYQLLDTAASELATSVQGFFADGGQGLNVTLPHKGAVIDLCEDVSSEAKLADAVNTLVPTDTGLVGENTDGRGLIRDLRRLGLALQGAKIVVIGAGGAARGIIAPLLASQPAELIWSNRSIEKLAGRDTPFAAADVLTIKANHELAGTQADLVIHASSAGHQGLCPTLPKQLFAPNAAAYDLSYGAAAQPFLNWSHDQGCALNSEGIGMLIEQAALAWQHWIGRLPDTAALHTQGLQSAP